MAIPFSRLRIALPLLAMLVLLAAWSIWWFWAVGFARDRLQQVRHDWHDRMQLSCTEESWGGYPYRFMFTCRQPRITLVGSTTDITAPSLDILAQAYNPQHIIARLTGPTRTVSPRHGLDVTASHLPAKLGIKLNGGKFAIATASVRDLEVTADTGRFSASSIAIHARPSLTQPAGFDFALEAANLSIVPPGASALVLSSLSAQATLDKPPAGPAANLPQLARALATTGSTLQIDRFTAQSGKLTITGSGSASITAEGFITGALTTIVNNPTEMIADMTERGILSPKQAGGATALLGLFTTNDGLKADLRLKDGEIYWGPLKLGKHAPLF